MKRKGKRGRRGSISKFVAKKYIEEKVNGNDKSGSGVRGGKENAVRNL